MLQRELQKRLSFEIELKIDFEVALQQVLKYF